MLIFGNDDNDDNLDLDFDRKQNKASPTPPNSSLPTRPVSKSPFGSNADQVDDLAPEKKTGLPVRNPAAPFGQAPQSNPGSKPRLPQNPLSEAQKPAPTASDSLVTQKPQAPFARPSVARREPVTPPVAPNLSSYLPPKITVEPVEEIAVEAAMEPEVLNETEQYLRTMKEHAQRNSEEAKRAEALKQASTPVTDTVTPLVNYIPPVAPPVAPESAGKKKKQGFFSPPPKKEKTPKKELSPAKQARISQYDGERKKVLYIRLVAGSVAVIIAVAGFQAIFGGDSGPTKAQMQSAAKEAVNYTGFPTTSGEQFALDFSKAYFNYDSRDLTRITSLERFASKDLVKQIDIQILSAAEYESVKKDSISYSNLSVTESISYGPYVVNSKNLTAENAVFTVKVGLKSGSVVYLDVPVKYDPKNYSMTLAGPPSFSKPIQNQGAVTTDQYTIAFEGGGDDKLEKDQMKDFEAYLTAWAVSDSTLVNRYVLDSATDNAKKGLQGSVKFYKITDLQIEPLDEEKVSTATQRRVEIKVMWEDPTTGLRYPQQYRMLIGKNPDDKWAIYDIENFVVLKK